MRKAMVARPGELLQRHQERVKKEVVDFGFANARVFGSVARGEDIPDSDIDIFVDLTDESAAGVGELFALTDRLENILSVRVDLKTVPKQTQLAVLSCKKPLKKPSLYERRTGARW